jgi:putative ubiquitin-RnfH superfamily antitoxin RatB of RatAB toxin-antitoxin module
MSLVTNESERDYAAFERAQETKALARKAIEQSGRRRAFVEIDLLQAVMDGDSGKAVALAKEMKPDERAELRDHLGTMKQILFDADQV